MYIVSRTPCLFIHVQTYIPDNLVLLLQVSRGEIHSLVDIRMSSYGTSSYKVWTVVAALKRRRRSIDEAIALRRC